MFFNKHSVDYIPIVLMRCMDQFLDVNGFSRNFSSYNYLLLRKRKGLKGSNRQLKHRNFLPISSDNFKKEGGAFLQ